jgi:dTDP-4-amino-4,6-dideoxygalactose transaminase
MDGILALARRHKLWVIEDAAHALPAYYEGKLIGTLGSLATVFSFYATKTVTTGEGGMLVTADVGLANTCRRSRQHGFDRDLFTRYSTPGAPWEYEIAEVGSKANLGDVAAAIGVAQLAKVFSFAEKRRALAQQYLAGLAGCVELPIVSTPNGTSANHLFVIRPTARSRDDLIEHLTNQGIGTSVHFKPLHLHKFYRDKLGTGENTCPVATEGFKRVISLPIYTRMTGDDAQRVIDAVHEFVHGTGQRN